MAEAKAIIARWEVLPNGRRNLLDARHIGGTRGWPATLLGIVWPVWLDGERTGKYRVNWKAPGSIDGLSDIDGPREAMDIVERMWQHDNSAHLAFPVAAGVALPASLGQTRMQLRRQRVADLIDLDFGYMMSVLREVRDDKRTDAKRAHRTNCGTVCLCNACAAGRVLAVLDAP